MKRVLLGFPVFLAAFLAGNVLVPQFTTMRSYQSSQKTEVRFTPLDPNSAPVIQPSEDKDFIPEFHGLPSFEDATAPGSEEKLIEILSDGIYRRSDVVAKSGEKWLVFFERDGKYSLKESTASVKKLESISWPGDEKDARLAFSGTGNPIIAVRNIPGLKIGEVNTLFFSPLSKDIPEAESREKEMDDNFRREFNLNGMTYILRTSEGVTKDNTQVAVLVLESNGRSQVIKQTYHVPSDEKDIIGSLLWAGDMDGDGKLDLYFDEFNEKGFTATELHLSSLAESGNLLRLAASFGMAGC